MFQYRRIIPAALCLMALLLTGCRSQKEAAATRPETHTETPPAVVTPPVYVPAYYTSNFTCTTQGVTANGQIRMQQDSIIWLSATKVIELGRAKLTPDSVIVYVKVAGRCFRGSYMDIYRRFRYRTTFDELQKMLTAPDAEKQIAALVKSFGIEAEIKLDPWKKVEKLTFPFSVPNNTTPF